MIFVTKNKIASRIREIDGMKKIDGSFRFSRGQSSVADVPSLAVFRIVREILSFAPNIAKLEIGTASEGFSRKVSTFRLSFIRRKTSRSLN